MSTFLIAAHPTELCLVSHQWKGIHLYPTEKSLYFLGTFEVAQGVPETPLLPNGITSFLQEVLRRGFQKRGTQCGSVHTWGLKSYRLRFPPPPRINKEKLYFLK